MPKKLKQQMTISICGEPPFDSVHYAAWGAGDMYHGGDFYSSYELPHNRFGLLIGDVPETDEHGTHISTAILTYVNDIVNREIEECQKNSRVVDARRVMEHIDREICENDQIYQSNFYPMLFSTFNMKTGSLKTVNAGMPNPVIMRNGKANAEKQKGHIVLGIQEQEFHYHRIHLEPGDCAVFYTDGITNVLHRDKEEPMRNFLAFLEQNHGKNFDAFLRAVGSLCYDYACKHSCKKNEPMDDMSITGFAYLKRSDS